MFKFQLIVLCLISIVSLSAVEIDDQTQGQFADGRYQSLDGSYSIVVPALGATSIKLACGEQSPGITWYVMAVGDNGVRGIIVSTKIRVGYPKDDRVIERNAANIKQGSLRDQQFLEDARFIGDKEGKIFQIVYQYLGQGTTREETDSFTGEVTTIRNNILGVSREFVRGDFFYEFIVMNEIRALDKSEDVLDDILDKLNNWMKQFTLKNGNNPGLVEIIDNYSKTDSYIRCEFEAPKNDQNKIAKLIEDKKKKAVEYRKRMEKSTKAYKLLYEIKGDAGLYKDKMPVNVTHVSSIGLSTSPLKDDVIVVEDAIAISDSVLAYMTGKSDTMFIVLKDETGLLFKFKTEEFQLDGDWTSWRKPEFLASKDYSAFNCLDETNKDKLSSKIPDGALSIRYKLISYD